MLGYSAKCMQNITKIRLKKKGIQEYIITSIHSLHSRVHIVPTVCRTSMYLLRRRCIFIFIFFLHAWNDEDKPKSEIS